MKKAIPFGLLFEEEVETTEYPLEPSYEPEQALSYITTQEGKMPFVEWEWNVYAGTQTSTATKDRSDTEDTDEEIRKPKNPSVRRPNTTTVTEIQETTD